MPVTRAKRLCPEAIFLRGDWRRYALASRKVFEILRHYSPLVEAVSIDEAYVDLSGLDRLYGPAIDVAERIQRELQERLRLTASAGLSTTKLVSKVASGYAKPGGIAGILPGYEARFLASLPVERLPGVGKEAHERLRLFNIKTIGSLAALDVRLMEMTFGNVGRLLHQRARGIDTSPILSAERPPKSIGREVTFEKDTIDRDYLEAILYGLTEKVARALRRTQMAARTVTLKLRYSDFKTLNRSATLAEPTVLDREIFFAARSLLERAFVRRSRVRLIGVSISNLQRDLWQLPLFGCERELRWRRLYEAIDRIRDRYGTTSLKVGRTAF